MDLVYAILAVLALLLLLFAASRFYFRWRRERRIESARQDYEQSLTLLCLKPREELVQQEVTTRGMLYARLLRESGREDVFDEEALNRQMERTIASAEQPASPGRRSAKERLDGLETLKAAGIIDEEQYEKERNEILSQLQ